jgi:hypothetical protein
MTIPIFVRANCMRSFFLFLFVIPFMAATAQDKILLLNGKIIEVKNVELSGYKIAYRTFEKNKLRKVDTERVFSIQYANGSEKVVYTANPADSLEYTVPQLRMFVKGEHDAGVFYNNSLNKEAAFLVGAGASFFAIYGLVGPPLYSTIVGAFSPDMDKVEVSEPSLRLDPDYREGYKSKVRNRKIRNSLIFGFLGFAAGAVTTSIIINN